MGAGGHMCIGSMGDFLAILDLLPNTAWSYHLLKHPKLHSNYSAGRRAMYHLPPYGGTRGRRPARKTALPRLPSSSRHRRHTCTAHRDRRCRPFSLFSHLRVCRCSCRGQWQLCACGRRQAAMRRPRAVSLLRASLRQRGLSKLAHASARPRCCLSLAQAPFTETLHRLHEQLIK